MIAHTLNSTDENGKTAFMYAAQYGNDDVSISLLDKGVDINGQDEDSKTTLLYAIKSGHTSTVEILLRNRAAFDIIHNDGGTALIYTTVFNRDAVVNLSKNAGATK